MIELFEYSEIDENDRIFEQYPALKINNSPHFYLILRGIVGNIKIKQTFREVTFNQERDFLNPVERSLNFIERENEDKIFIEEDLKSEIKSLLEILKTKCKSNLEILPKYISDTFSLKDLSDVLLDRKTINRNKDFFETLNNEFCNFYYNTSKENHTIAFLHLYRILEYISYSFPVMYAASTTDFSESFDVLKTLFSGDKDKGELKVFKDFIEIVMSSEKEYQRLTIDINIVSNSEDYNKKIYSTIIKICDKSFFDETKNTENSKISIKFTEFSSFIITIRNRFFHLKNSQSNNIHSADIVDSDFFFGLINHKCAYFLSLVTLSVIKKSYFQK